MLKKLMLSIQYMLLKMSFPVQVFWIRESHYCDNFIIPFRDELSSSQRCEGGKPPLRSGGGQDQVCPSLPSGGQKLTMQSGWFVSSK